MGWCTYAHANDRITESTMETCTYGRVDESDGLLPGSKPCVVDQSDESSDYRRRRRGSVHEDELAINLIRINGCC